MEPEKENHTAAESTNQKALALRDGSGSSHAYCVGSTGAFKIINHLSPQLVQEAFNNTPPSELREMASMLDEHIREVFDTSKEGQIKDLSFKRGLLLRMADDNSDKEVVTQSEDGTYENFSEE